ncbi:hypothetical protein [Nocardia jejuensis]|uniref:hypothetical protein n=1 Tax=Nocardia jejuensis TaxID=328049 RepID=UPI0008345C72|nr:hypothetical protein [Nocardia jejuensis]
MRTRLGAAMFTGAMILAPAFATVPATAAPASPAPASDQVADSGSANAPKQLFCALEDLRRTLSAGASGTCSLGWID